MEVGSESLVSSSVKSVSEKALMLQRKSAGLTRVPRRSTTGGVSHGVTGTHQDQFNADLRSSPEVATIGTCGARPSLRVKRPVPG
jgi:hypothetical protein